MVELKSKRANAFQGYPRGWFVIGFSDELEIGGIQKLKYFGQDMVLFRGNDGKPCLLDAYCPHLGAHLGANGKVVDNSIECPFHAWRFGSDGKCVHIPYAKKIPKKACVRSWKLEEKNGLIHVWYHPHDKAPEWELPSIDAWGDAEWTRWTPSMLHIKTHPREIMENVVDKGHFPKVHNTHPKSFENEFTDTLAIQRLTALAYPQGGGEDLFTITATYHGPGFQISEMSGTMDSRLINAHTPVDENSLDLRFGVMLRKIADPAKMEKYGKMYSENLRLGFHEDISIWENKVYRDTPVLCDGDGPVMKLRRWYEKFYDNPAPGPEVRPVSAAQAAATAE